MTEVLDKLSELSWVPHDVFSVHLAMEEALVNAIRHGNRLDDSKKVHLVCQIAPDMVRIRIADEGAGFDPNSLPDPTAPDNIESTSGRGIMLMKSFMSRVDYNQSGNCVTLEKFRAKANY